MNRVNQIDIHFSILTRTTLTPMGLPHRQAVKERIQRFQERYIEIPRLFHWNSTGDQLLERLKEVAN